MDIMEKERLDLLLVKKGLAASREKGRALIMAGQVYVNQVRTEKPGVLVNPADSIEVRGKPFPYVSRGGLKLEKALQVFGIVLQDKIVLDAGASTGGFTHCALLHGASRVYAVDVGYGQLDWSLRQDRRVISLERKNARRLEREDIPEQVDVITIDVSFISLEKIMPNLASFLRQGGQVIALIKPQFEAGRDKVGKKGVVRDPRVHREVIERVIGFCCANGLVPRGLSFSPLTGPEGNIEFLLWLEKSAVQEEPDREATDQIGNMEWPKIVDDVVKEAHQELRKEKSIERQSD